MTKKAYDTKISKNKIKNKWRNKNNVKISIENKNEYKICKKINS